MDNRWPQTQVQFVQQWVIYSMNHPASIPGNIPIMQQPQVQPPWQTWPNQPQYQTVFVPDQQQLMVPLPVQQLLPLQQQMPVQYQQPMPMSQPQGYVLTQQFGQTQGTFSQPIVPYVQQQQPQPMLAPPPPQQQFLQAQQPIPQAIHQQVQQPIQQQASAPPQPLQLSNQTFQKQQQQPMQQQQQAMQQQQPMLQQQFVQTQQSVQQPISAPTPQITQQAVQPLQVTSQVTSQPVQVSSPLANSQQVPVPVSQQMQVTPSPIKSEIPEKPLHKPQPPQQLFQQQTIKIECDSDENAPVDEELSGHMFIDNETEKIEAVTITHKQPEAKRGNRKTRRSSALATESKGATAPDSSEIIHFGGLDVTTEEAEKVKEFLQQMRTQDPTER